MTQDEMFKSTIKDIKDRIAGLEGEERMNYLMGLLDGMNTATHFDPAAFARPKIEAFYQFLQSAQGKSLKDKQEDRQSPDES